MAYVDVKTRKRNLIAWLKREHSPRYVVSVRTLAMKEEIHGDTTFNGQRFLIRLARRQSFALWADTLLHEWAHVLTFHGTDGDVHGPEWGLAYARLYRAYERWDASKRVTLG